MKTHPPYHLRMNKAVERLAWVKSIWRLPELKESLSDYAYYGLGGPYLDEFRLVYEFYPELQMVSFEEDLETYKRQEFHRPCGKDILELKHEKFTPAAVRTDKPVVCWLDYTKHSNANIADFATLVGVVAPHSMLKITLCAELDQVKDKDKFSNFAHTYKEYVELDDKDTPATDTQLAKLFQKVVHGAVAKGLPTGTDDMRFQILSSCYYIDGGPLVFTLTGIVCFASEVETVKKMFKTSPFAVFDWDTDPKAIDLPFLSTKERLHLQKCLPCKNTDTDCLRKELGYDTDGKQTIRKLGQYAEFHTYFPYFIKATP